VQRLDAKAGRRSTIADADWACECCSPTTFIPMRRGRRWLQWSSPVRRRLGARMREGGHTERERGLLQLGAQRCSLSDWTSAPANGRLEIVSNRAERRWANCRARFWMRMVGCNAGRRSAGWKRRSLATLRQTMGAERVVHQSRRKDMTVLWRRTDPIAGYRRAGACSLGQWCERAPFGFIRPVRKAIGQREATRLIPLPPKRPSGPSSMLAELRVLATTCFRQARGHWKLEERSCLSVLWSGLTQPRATVSFSRMMEVGTCSYTSARWSALAFPALPRAKRFRLNWRSIQSAARAAPKICGSEKARKRAVDRPPRVPAAPRMIAITACAEPPATGHRHRATHLPWQKHARNSGDEPRASRRAPKGWPWCKSSVASSQHAYLMMPQRPPLRLGAVRRSDGMALVSAPQGLSSGRRPNLHPDLIADGRWAVARDFFLPMPSSCGMAPRRVVRFPSKIFERAASGKRWALSGQLLLRLDVAFVQRDRLLAAIQYDANPFTAGGFAHDDAGVNFHPRAAGSAQGRQPYPHARFQFAVFVVAHSSSMRKKLECQQGTPSHREQQDAHRADSQG